MFKWKKLGQIFDPTKMGNNSWMQEQAQNPFALETENAVRVYFNCRAIKDSEGKSTSYGAYIELDKNNLFKITEVANKPLLELGEKGAFDEFGVMAGSVIKSGNEYLLYYCGWTRMLSVPYNWAIGLARSTDGGKSFSRVGPGPVLGATFNEPYLQAGCSSIINIDGTYHLWYTSGVKWITAGDKPESVYRIMHATSKDGINWNRNGKAVIDEVLQDEAQASPTVIKLNGKWHMFFSYRHSVDFRNKDRGYRIGYAWSDDMINWNREDQLAGISVSESGWDSEMICYPNICSIGNKVYLFYCGNDFGKYGFGVAQLES